MVPWQILSATEFLSSTLMNGLIIEEGLPQHLSVSRAFIDCWETWHHLAVPPLPICRLSGCFAPSQLLSAWGAAPLPLAGSPVGGRGVLEALPLQKHCCHRLVAQGAQAQDEEGAGGQALCPRGSLSLWQAKWPGRAIPRRGALCPPTLLLLPRLVRASFRPPTPLPTQPRLAMRWPPSQRLPDVTVASAPRIVPGPIKGPCAGPATR